jgi:hypothetical protein
MNPDFVDLLHAFIAADVRFLIVGAYAPALHRRPRATGDLDVWIDATPENAARVIRALADFGAPLTDVSVDDFSREGVTATLRLAIGLMLAARIPSLLNSEKRSDVNRRDQRSVTVLQRECAIPGCASDDQHRRWGHANSAAVQSH